MVSPIHVKSNILGWSPYVKVYDPLKAGSIDGTDLIPHDNAVIRAISAEYIPPDKQSVQSNPCNTLFVSRLNLRTSEKQLCEEFSKFGPVKSCRVVEDIVTGISRGYGFIEFKREADAQKAWRLAHGTTFHERQILVEWEFSRTMPGWIPRRLGGGLGGKKESGQLRFGGRDRPFRKPFILPPEEDMTACKSYKSFDSTEKLQSDEAKKPSSSRNELENNVLRRSKFDSETHRRNSEDCPTYEGNRKWQRIQDDYGYAQSKKMYTKEMNDNHPRHSYWNEEGRKYQAYSSSSYSKYDYNKKRSYEDRKSSHYQRDNSKKNYRRYDDESSSFDTHRGAATKSIKEDQSSRKRAYDHYSDHENRVDHEASYYNFSYEQKYHHPPQEKEDKYMIDASDFNISEPESSQSVQGISKSQERPHKRKHKSRDSTDSSKSETHRTKKKKSKSRHKRKRDRSESVSSNSSTKRRHSSSHKKKKKKRKHKHRASGSSSD